MQILKLFCEEIINLMLAIQYYRHFQNHCIFKTNNSTPTVEVMKL